MAQGSPLPAELLGPHGRPCQTQSPGPRAARAGHPQLRPRSWARSRNVRLCQAIQLERLCKQHPKPEPHGARKEGDQKERPRPGVTGPS